MSYRNDPKFQTDRSGQTVQAQIRLLLMEQSDQGLHCLSFSADLYWTNFSMETPFCLNFRVIAAYILGVQKFRYNHDCVFISDSTKYKYIILRYYKAALLKQLRLQQQQSKTTSRQPKHKRHQEANLAVMILQWSKTNT